MKKNISLSLDPRTIYGHCEEITELNETFIFIRNIFQMFVSIQRHTGNENFFLILRFL